MSLRVMTEQIELSTDGDCHIVDLTSEVSGKVQEAGLKEGHVLMFCPGSTGGFTTVEYEPGLLKDIPDFFERIAPKNMRYHHDETWHDGNGHSHVRATLIGPSLTIPVTEGKLTLGTWQQIIFIDFDNKPRDRTLIIQLYGTG